MTKRIALARLPLEEVERRILTRAKELEEEALRLWEHEQGREPFPNFSPARRHLLKLAAEVFHAQVRYMVAQARFEHGPKDVPIEHLMNDNCISRPTTIRFPEPA